MGPPPMIDIDDIIITAAQNFPFERDIRRAMDDDIKSTDINTKHLRVIHDAPVYKNEQQIGQSQNHTLFKAVFTNSTDNDQIYNFNTQRKTRSTCTLICTKGYRFEAHMDIKMLPPNPVLQANGGFKSEMFLTKADGQTFEEELLWSVDSQVRVPPMHKTTAALVIKEDEYNGNFTVRSQFMGKVHVTIRNRKDHSQLTTITMKVEQVFTPDLGFQVDKSGVYCVTQGVCKCRYGIQQRVKLTQASIGKGGDDSDEE